MKDFSKVKLYRPHYIYLEMVEDKKGGYWVHEDGYQALLEAYQEIK